MTFLKANVFKRSNKVSFPATARGKYKYLGVVIRLFLGIWKNSSLHAVKKYIFQLYPNDGVFNIGLFFIFRLIS